jgi:UDPglucose 6-dehydrogenase
VARAIGMDSRIGPKFLNASVGFGGSCFQKDILNLVYIARSYGLAEVADYWEQVIIMNDHQKDRFAKKIVRELYNTISGKKIIFLGWAFKKDTNDTRESAAIYVANLLLQEQAELAIYDPQVSEKQIKSDLTMYTDLTADVIENRVHVYQNTDNLFETAHAIAVLTEWDEFKTYDWASIYKQVTKPAFVFDGRNILPKNELIDLGFKYYAIGS